MTKPTKNIAGQPQVKAGGQPVACRIRTRIPNAPNIPSAPDSEFLITSDPPHVTLAQLIEHHRKHNNRAQDDILRVGFDVKQVHDVVEHAN